MVSGLPSCVDSRQGLGTGEAVGKWGWVSPCPVGKPDGPGEEHGEAGEGPSCWEDLLEEAVDVEVVEGVLFVRDKVDHLCPVP